LTLYIEAAIPTKFYEDHVVSASSMLAIVNPHHIGVGVCIGMLSFKHQSLVYFALQ
jgi:hypothetical protein